MICPKSHSCCKSKSEFEPVSAHGKGCGRARESGVLKGGGHPATTGPPAWDKVRAQRREKQGPGHQTVGFCSEEVPHTICLQPLDWGISLTCR